MKPDDGVRGLQTALARMGYDGNDDSDEMLGQLDNLAVEIDSLSGADSTACRNKYLASLSRESTENTMLHVEWELESQIDRSSHEVLQLVQQVQGQYKKLRFVQKTERISDVLNTIKDLKYNPSVDWDFMEGSEILSNLASDVSSPQTNQPAIAHMIALGDVRQMMHTFLDNA